MANFTASFAISQAALPPLKARTDQQHGRIRLFEALYQAPASGTTPAIADKIIWGNIPIGGVMQGHLGRLDFNTGTAACTLNVGDSVVAARHLAATAINATGSAIPSAASFIQTATADVTLGSFDLLNVKGIGAFTVGDLVTGTGIPAASTIQSVDIARAKVTFTNLALTAATATNAAQTITSTGHGYRASDATANASNLYVSTTDDSLLISVVAGAQISNNQMIRLIMPYVMD